MSEPKTLLLTETGVAQLPDGSNAINVGPIVRALAFLTEGRGDDRGTDELGNPLPDLMSLAFDVIESIILGGRKAEFFRRVKHELETQGEGTGDRSLALAKQARRVRTRAMPTALDEAVQTVNDMLVDLRGLSLPEERARQLDQSLEVFRAFGADRWVSATAQLLLALSALGTLDLSAPGPKRESKPKRESTRKPKRESTRKPKRESTRKPKRESNREPKLKSKPARASKPTAPRTRRLEASRSPKPAAAPRQKARATVTASKRPKTAKRTRKKR